MGGNISVESNVGVGSKFVVCIDPGKIADTERKNLTFKRSDYKSSTEVLNKISGKILIVDDIDDIRRLLGYVCRSFGLEVSYANNGQQAITKIVSADKENTKYDLVLMDIHMPVLDGKRTIKQLREMHVNTPIIAITAATMKGVRKELKGLGFNDVVAKPIDKYELHKKIQQQLNLQISALNQTKSVISSVPTTQNDKENKPNQRVLLIEDDIDAAEITALLLSTMGKHVQVANNAEQAKNIVKTDIDWQHILVDMNLPDGNGLELSSSLKTQLPNTIITIVSGYEVSKQVITENGANSSLLKPVNLTMLQQLFNEA